MDPLGIDAILRKDVDEKAFRKILISQFDGNDLISSKNVRRHCNFSASAENLNARSCKRLLGCPIQAPGLHCFYRERDKLFSQNHQYMNSWAGETKTILIVTEKKKTINDNRHLVCKVSVWGIGSFKESGTIS